MKLKKMELTDECVNQITVDDPLFETVGMTGTWGIGNQFALVAGNVKAVSSGGDLGPILIHEAKWNKDMHCDVMRKLMNESHQVFLEIQSEKDNLSQGSQSRTLLIKFSRKYRSILRACVFELKTKIGSEVAENKELQKQMEILQIMEIIWNLCEILFFENSPSGMILTRLVEWLRWHFPRADDLTEECLQTDNPHTHEIYWSALKCLVLQGRTEDARNMLKLHPLCRGNEMNAYVSLEELLRKMPQFTYYRGQSVVEFEMKWKHWQEECIYRYKEGEFDENDNLREIAMILCGNYEVFENPEFGCWYEMMVARLLYTKPTVSIRELQQHSRLSVDTFGGRNHIGSFDRILLAALELDPYLVIKECSHRFSNWWLAAHLSDLFHHAGLLLHHKMDFQFDFREHLILEYANGLMVHPSFWKVTIDYLSSCSENGNDYVPLYVRKIPLTSEKKVAKLLQICKKRQLYPEIRSICRQMSVSAQRTGRLGAALTWAIRSNDSAQAMKISEKLLAEYEKTGKFECIDLLDHLGPNVLVSERLTFLGKYRDFHKFMTDGHLKAAGKLLSSLITSNIAPMEFRPSLLADMIPLLLSDELVYNVSETGDLIAHLNSLDLKSKKLARTESDSANLQQQLELLRLYLARNLAKAIVST